MCLQLSTSSQSEARKTKDSQANAEIRWSGQVRLILTRAVPYLTRTRRWRIRGRATTTWGRRLIFSVAVWGAEMH